MGLLHIIGLTAPSVPRGWMADTACIAREVCCVLRSRAGTAPQRRDHLNRPATLLGSSDFRGE